MNFQLFQRALEQLIKAIENSAVATVRAVTKTITTHTYEVKVNNHPKTIDVRKGNVIVTNQKNMEAEIRKVKASIDALSKIIPQLKEVTATVKNPTKIPPFPKFPTEMSVTNLKDVPVVDVRNVIFALDEVTRQIKKLKLDPQITIEAPPAPIVNIPKADAPIVKFEEREIDLSSLKELRTFFEELIGDPTRPLPVQLSDGKKFYKALDEVVQAVSSSRSVSPFVTKDGDETRATVNRNGELQVTVNDTWDVNDTEKASTTLTYFGEESVDGKWRVRSVTKSGNLTSIRHATARNNSSYTGYEAAWNDRENLDYGYAREAL
jgi:hypothetical protein